MAKKEKNKKSELSRDGSTMSPNPRETQTSALLKGLSELQADEESDDMPAGIKPLPRLDSPQANVAQKLDDLLEDNNKEGEI